MGWVSRKAAADQWQALPLTRIFFAWAVTQHQAALPVIQIGLISADVGPPYGDCSPSHPRGVLAKVSKPGQDARIDLPTIGPATVRNASRAGLAGVAGEAGLVLVVDRAAVVGLSDELGLFVIGVPPGAGVKPV